MRDGANSQELWHVQEEYRVQMFVSWSLTIQIAPIAASLWQWGSYFPKSKEVVWKWKGMLIIHHQKPLFIHQGLEKWITTRSVLRKAGWWSLVVAPSLAPQNHRCGRPYSFSLTQDPSYRCRPSICHRVPPGSLLSATQTVLSALLFAS